MTGTHTVAEQIARQSYGRLLAILAKSCRDIASAEDALSEALATALRAWPETGVPDQPEAWLLTTARRIGGKQARHAMVRNAARNTVILLANEIMAQDSSDIPDARLEMLFACAHPAIAPDIRTPLMMQVVLGLDAARIARAYAMAPAAMGQRLVRAKTKIRDAGISFCLPDTDDLPARVDDVLAAIYAAYTLDFDDVSGLLRTREPLTGEAIFLARLIVMALPDQAEPKGLLALLLYCESRASTRRDMTGDYVRLSDQNARHWDADMLKEAEALLLKAADLRQFGRFQNEAAIQSLHAQAAMTGDMPVTPLLQLYDVLVAHWPSVGAMVARAAAYARWRTPEIGLALLDAIDIAAVRAYQPYWVTLAHISRCAGQTSKAKEASAQALLLTTDPVLRKFLMAEAGLNAPGRV